MAILIYLDNVTANMSESQLDKAKRTFTYVIAKLVMAYHKRNNFVDSTAKHGDWGIEISSMFRLGDEGYSYQKQIFKVDRVDKNKAKYTGVDLGGNPVEWINALVYKIPDEIYETLDDIKREEDETGCQRRIKGKKCGGELVLKRVNIDLDGTKIYVCESCGGRTEAI